MERRDRRYYRELCEIIRPVMLELARRTGLSVLLGVVAGNQALCMERIDPSPNRVRKWRPGSRLALNCGAAPRVLLAYLPEPRRRAVLAAHLGRLTDRSQLNQRALARELQHIRARGWEFVADDVAIGMAAVGVPVPDRTGNVVAALSVAAPTDELVDPSGPRFLDDLQRAARGLSPRLVDPASRAAR